MTTIDWIIVLIYASSTIGCGWYFGRRQKNTSEYFVGSGAMNPTLIGVSLFATLLSTITYLAIPGEVLGKGPVYLTNYLAYPLVYLVVGYVILPIYMRQRVTSAYALLEERLGLSIRLLGAIMFLAMRLVWMSLMMFMTANAIAVMTGVDENMVPWIALATGAFAVTYASLGGLRAVVVTDLLQTLLLYGGALLVIATVSWQMGGFGWFPTQWQNKIWDEQPIISFDPATRVTVVGSILSVLLWTVCTSMGDQVSVQRFMSTKNATAARRAIAVQLILACVVGATLGLVGIALLGFFQANLDLLPGDSSLKMQADQLFAHFIAAHLPPVVTGLVVSGLFAAAMSSIDSGVNSITAVVMTDFMERFERKPDTESQHLRFARCLAVAIGAIVILLSSVYKFIPGNFLAVTNKTVNLLPVPIALLFFFALMVPFANAKGVWISTIASVTTAVLVAYSEQIFGANPETGLPPISFQWISPAALVVGLVVGLVACWLFDDRRETSQSGNAGENA
ncbi:MAG: sodium-coupled permease [Pirellulaceae bacterium]